MHELGLRIGWAGLLGWMLGPCFPAAQQLAAADAQHWHPTKTPHFPTAHAPHCALVLWCLCCPLPCCPQAQAQQADAQRGDFMTIMQQLMAERARSDALQQKLEVAAAAAAAATADNREVQQQLVAELQQRVDLLLAQQATAVARFEDTAQQLEAERRRSAALQVRACACPWGGARGRQDVVCCLVCGVRWWPEARIHREEQQLEGRTAA